MDYWSLHPGSTKEQMWMNLLLAHHFSMFREVEVFLSRPSRDVFLGVSVLQTAGGSFHALFTEHLNLLTWHWIVAAALPTAVMFANLEMRSTLWIRDANLSHHDCHH